MFENQPSQSIAMALNIRPLTGRIGAQIDDIRLAGDLQRQWRGKGLTLSLPDVTIAAVAIEHRLILLTDNKRHFPMPELLSQPLP